ncbi:unnamed protein product [Oppiella nova]|uniref:Uncharacterized protein n=1 Tax=Oppiella nova TaxID=334625 RepID=A0A7R9M9M3_9ACAR|nr:unnamed protein product [Oppiella nova]CAG2173277.1 unnamed protein product [Oppiella nova]
MPLYPLNSGCRLNKKSKECENTSTNSETNVTSYDHLCSNRSLCQHSLSVPEADNKSCYSDILPNSPISPRVKNIHSDMEALMLSRHDNPYIMQQLERLSTRDAAELYAEMNVSGHPSPARSLHKISFTNLEANPTTDTNSMMDSDISDTYIDNLHDKLIRSPPPQFPKNLSLFIFPGSSAVSVQSYRTADNCDFSPSRLHMSPNACHSLRDVITDHKIKTSNTSQDNISGILNSYSRDNQFLEPNPNLYNKYERRGSDSSILSNNWKTTFYNQSMAASSSSLLTFAPRCPPLDSCTTASNDSNMSCTECQSEHKSDTGLDSMEMYPNLDDNCTDGWNAMSASNSREALLKNISQLN